MKLTPRQVEVIRLMADRWSLGTSDGDARLQKGGLGMGGESRTVHHATFWSLYQNGYIQRGERDHLTTEWVLTAAGRQEAELRKVEP